jgi:transcription initiation factor TFIIIB Brf1 subunit/transcription initiation factor TFIIB
MHKKLKTKLTFEFDTKGVEEEIPQLSFDLDLKTNVKKKSINIIKTKKKKIKEDASTRLF